MSTTLALDPEIDERIDYFHEMDYITPAQQESLKAYFKHGNYHDAAEDMGIDPRSLHRNLSEMTRRCVLLKAKRNSPYVLNHNESEIIRINLPIEYPPDPPLQMSEYERKWMIKNYRNYRNNRSEVCKILNRSRLDVCRMAIALKLDSKN